MPALRSKWESSRWQHVQRQQSLQNWDNLKATDARGTCQDFGMLSEAPGEEYESLEEGRKRRTSWRPQRGVFLLGVGVRVLVPRVLVDRPTRFQLQTCKCSRFSAPDSIEATVAAKIGVSTLLGIKGIGKEKGTAVSS